MRFSLTSLLVFVTIFAVCCWLSVNVYPFGILLAWPLMATYIGIFVYKLRNGWLGAVYGVMLIFGTLFISLLVMDRCPVRPYLLEQIHIGSPSTEVQSLLGSPGSIAKYDSGEHWQYSTSLWCHISISFDGDGKVKGIDHDH